MIDMADLVTKQHTFLDLKSGSKRQVLQSLSEVAARDTGLESGRILDALMQREKLGTTGLGDGIAIPHARVPELDGITGFFARLSRPVDFDALDGQPVDLVFLLLAPDGAGADHLKALARVARVLRDAELCEALRRAERPEEAHAILTGHPGGPGPRAGAAG
jgi:nitrogen PTS system EIIA component